MNQIRDCIPLILSNLPPISRLRLRRVCKSWNKTYTETDVEKIINDFIKATQSNDIIIVAIIAYKYHKTQSVLVHIRVTSSIISKACVEIVKLCKHYSDKYQKKSVKKLKYMNPFSLA